jgi:deoxyribonuclease V
VAGVDVSYEKHGNQFFAAVVVLSWPGLELIESASATTRVDFPYIPGLLSFRELPALLQAFAKLQAVPDLIMVDGQGIAHPRRFGIASHLGLWLDLPTIGCGKSRLCGEHDEPGLIKGDQVPLIHQEEQIGTVLTTRSGVKPVYVSPGYKVDFTRAADMTLAAAVRYRLPEPTRQAHLYTNRLRLQATPC